MNTLPIRFVLKHHNYSLRHVFFIHLSMKNILFCYLLFPLVIACKKQHTAGNASLPEPDPASIDSTYPVVTAATMIASDSADLYRLGLAPYASFFTFDRGMKNGEIYYEAIQESILQFKPLKFFILNNGTGKISAITTPSAAEATRFNEQWHR